MAMPNALAASPGKGVVSGCTATRKGWQVDGKGQRAEFELATGSTAAFMITERCV
jgi:hypothetical protein